MIASLMQHKAKHAAHTSPGTGILPAGASPAPLALPHFPARHQAVIWRNWEMIPARRLAEVLGTSEAEVTRTAAEMGLAVPQVIEKKWLERGFLTIIRNNWHLLPYAQLLCLLGWTAERLDYCLREEDFLWHKMGFLKPAAKPVRFRRLTAAEQRRTAALRQTLARHFPENTAQTTEKSFAFLNRLGKRGMQGRTADRFKNFTLRLVYSYAAVYGDPLLDPSLDPYPDDLLAQYRDLGVNAVWLQGILYTLTPWDAAPELSRGHEKRLATLRKLTERAAKFGIGVYIYLNEPRALPLKFFEAHPDWLGVKYPESGVGGLCTSQEPVVEFIENGSARLFREAPGLKGVFTITMSENPTNCFSKERAAQCPRCSRRPPAEVVAEVNNSIERGVHRESKNARVIVWTWAWRTQWEHAAIDLLSPKIELMCVSEWGLPDRTGGTSARLVDYSISQVGPSARAKAVWAHARKRGLKTVAKIQVNNTWECSAVPFIPVPDLVEKHLQNLKHLGVGGIMAGWTLGGFPGGNLELLRKSPAGIAGSFGKKAAVLVRRGQRLMSMAFSHFPAFNSGVLYTAPQNYGPMNLLYAKPTGYRATMLGFPYDDVERWRGNYSEAVLEKKFRQVSTGWKQGLECIQRALDAAHPKNRARLEDYLRIAEAAYCHFRSAYLQVRFVRLRAAGRKPEMRKVVLEEIKLAKDLYRIARADSRVGFEASNHYYYSLNSLREKVLNCEYLLKRLRS